MLAIATALLLIELTGPQGQTIELNSAAIVTLRLPRRGDHFAPGTHCLVHTADGKVVTVQETCPEVRRRIENAVQAPGR